MTKEPYFVGHQSNDDHLMMDVTNDHLSTMCALLDLVLVPRFPE